MTGDAPFRRSLDRLGWAALLWERLWPALWPAVGVVLAFAVAVAFDLLPLLPVWLHALALAGTAIALVACILSCIRTVRLPSPDETKRRLERDSFLPHRPLTAMRDRLEVGSEDPFAAALWKVHRQRMATATGALRVAWPRAGLAERDPYGIRVLLVLLLGIGILGSGGDFRQRLRHALFPAFTTATPQVAVGFDLWITPPDYTGLPPIYRGTEVPAAKEGGEEPPIPVPAGSTVLARVHGGSVTPALMLGGTSKAFDTLAEGEFSLSSPLGAANLLVLRQGGAALAGYRLLPVPDQPPTARWTEPPTIMQRGTLRFDYAAEDDYGIKRLALKVSRPGSGEPPVRIAVTVPSQAKEIKSALFEDLTASPWAGLPVELTLIAHDTLGQRGRSAPLTMTLPQREFHNPVAKAVIEQRALLRRDPAQSDLVSETLGDLSLQTALYHDDSSVYLGLRAASRRLALDRTAGADKQTQNLLWDIALRIEDGDTPEAQKSLSEVEKELQDALDRNAPDAEIARLTAQLDRAIQRYLQALTAQGPQAQAPRDSGGRSISPEDIHKMVEEAQRLAQTGARDAAKQALNNLQTMLDSLRTGQPRTGQGAGSGTALQDLVRRQTQLLDRSYDAERQGRGGKSGAAPGDLAGSQDQLRQELDGMMRGLARNGATPQALERAEQWMKSATEALRRGQPGDAVGSESEALGQLQQGARELAEHEGQGQGGGGQAATTDPFGRNGTARTDGDDVKLPGAVELQRSREILDELRRRAGQPDRSQLERDYLNRLLQPF